MSSDEFDGEAVTVEALEAAALDHVHLAALAVRETCPSALAWKPQQRARGALSGVKFRLNGKLR
jgi:hypothetical protein